MLPLNLSRLFSAALSSLTSLIARIFALNCFVPTHCALLPPEKGTTNVRALAILRKLSCEADEA